MWEEKIINFVNKVSRNIVNSIFFKDFHYTIDNYGELSYDIKKKFYDLSKLLECGCNWNILYGMRANGKSYAVKEHALKQAFNKGVKMFLFL